MRQFCDQRVWSPDTRSMLRRIARTDRSRLETDSREKATALSLMTKLMALRWSSDSPLTVLERHCQCRNQAKKSPDTLAAFDPPSLIGRTFVLRIDLLIRIMANSIWYRLLHILSFSFDRRILSFICFLFPFLFDAGF